MSQEDLIEFKFLLRLLKQIKSRDVLRHLCDCLISRVYLGEWIPDELYQPEISMPWIASDGRRFTLRRRLRAGRFYWYLYGTRHCRYVGKDLDAVRLQKLATQLQEENHA